MLLWIFFALLTGAATILVMAPLLRGGAPLASGSAEGTQAALLDEIEAEAASGLIDKAQAEAARAEIARRFLRATQGAAAAAPLKTERAPAFALAVGAGVTVVALGLYLTLGSPEVPDQPLSGRGEEIARLKEFRGLIGELEARLAADPAQPRGWEILAQSYLRLGNVDGAIDAFGKAAAASKPEDADGYYVAQAQVLIERDGGVIGATARDILSKALAANPRNVLARYLSALGADQAGDYDDAIARWQALLDDMPEGMPFRGEIEERLAAARAAAAR
ncbi:MAG: c-type cytochrome biogenesis protein CcmI [Alphaproteobacteria bacterium]|nr:c-type cytochrome biogenesis protein CcmI [Alphaproteobacteria bacterium]